MAAIPQGFASLGTSLYPQFGNGIYVGNNPGSTNIIPRGSQPAVPQGGGYGGADWTATNTGITLQTDWYTGGYISSIADQPNNVFRLTGDGGVGYIEGSNIAFSMPYTGTAGVTVLPSTGTINATGPVSAQSFFSANAPNGTGGQALISQNYSVTVNNTSTITSANLAFIPINGGVNGVGLRMNFYNAQGQLLYVRDL